MLTYVYPLSQEQFFVHDGMEHRPLGTTTSITGITAANDFIFVVASSGVCMAFRHTKNSSIAPYSMWNSLSRTFWIYLLLTLSSFLPVLKWRITVLTGRDGQIWYFNNLGERIKLVFYNKINDSIIIVALTRHGIGYQTRALPLEYEISYNIYVIF
jgi:hypothetical protein